MINLKTTENSIKLLTKDKYCDDDINVTFEGGSGGKLYKHEITIYIELQQAEMYLYTKIYSTKEDLGWDNYDSIEEAISYIFHLSFEQNCHITYIDGDTGETYKYNGSFYIVGGTIEIIGVGVQRDSFIKNIEITTDYNDNGYKVYNMVLNGQYLTDVQPRISVDEDLWEEV